jgi:hypothetical protein
MEKVISQYFKGIEDPRVQGRCQQHLLSDILLTALCTYITGGVDYQDMHLFARDRGKQLQNPVELPNGSLSADPFERIFKWIKAKSSQEILETYGKKIRSCFSRKK